MTGFFFALALAAYFLASLAYILHFSYRRGYLSWVATGLVALGFASHSVALGLRIAHLTTLPVTGLYDFFSVFAWVVILAYGVAQITLGIQQLGLFVVPISFGALGAGLVLGGEALPQPEVFQSVWLSLHIAMAFLGGAIFVLLFGVGLMYLIQERQVKGKHFGTWFYRLPSLQVLDDVNRKALVLGFPILTLGLVSGSLWAETARGSLLSWDPARTLPLVVLWGAYGVLFVARLTAGWRGKRAAFFSVLGFFGVLLTYLLHL